MDNKALLHSESQQFIINNLGLVQGNCTDDSTSHWESSEYDPQQLTKPLK